MRLVLVLLCLTLAGARASAQDEPGNRWPVDSGRANIGTTPRFHAPQGPYDRLNKTSFVGTITPSPQGGAVIIRAFKIL